jgi:hypothetical protein
MARRCLGGAAIVFPSCRGISLAGGISPDTGPVQRGALSISATAAHGASQQVAGDRSHVGAGAVAVMTPRVRPGIVMTGRDTRCRTSADGRSARIRTPADPCGPRSRTRSWGCFVAAAACEVSPRPRDAGWRVLDEFAGHPVAVQAQRRGLVPGFRQGPLRSGRALLSRRSWS